MTAVPFTPEQRQAIETVDRSVLVSAAAGSGKTAVLAERCAYLVCDAPAERRCSCDELVVLTFTDAAAAEMRARIVEAIRARARRQPADDRLGEQVALVEAAHISTIHSFCYWLIRRWFNEIHVDPGAVLLDAHEAALLKREVQETLFAERYAAAPSVDDPLGGRELGDEPRESGNEFTRLVDLYGLGDDGAIAAFVVKLHDFTQSLPDPEGWLREEREKSMRQPRQVVRPMATALRTELLRQIEHVRQMTAALSPNESCRIQFEQMVAYGEALGAWSEMLPEHDGSRLDEALSAFDDVRAAIGEFEFSSKTGPRLSKEADAAAVRAREAVGRALAEVKRLFKDRLRARFYLFSADEWVDTVTRCAPYTAALVDLVGAFGEAYAARKRRMAVLDFADLERFAYRLLSDGADAGRPSAIARSIQERFRYVLVDEFQDINPVQQAIIRLISREDHPALPGNLFTVGDVKQSIYRFRLAEPTLFLERLHRFRATSSGSDAESNVAIMLSRNFRSRGEILEGVNLVFRQLMREGISELVYDESSELRQGRAGEAPSDRRPIELHLVERSPLLHEEDGMEDGAEGGVIDPRDPGRWEPIEREAYLIGSRIREWIHRGGGRKDDSLSRYRDVAVLLRARKYNAERVASVLTMMGIPAYTEASGSLFTAREVREAVAVLRLLDNLQQDIPLAAVLRCGIMGDVFSADELVEIRCIDRKGAFHEAVRRYARQGRDDELRVRLDAVRQRLARYRDEVRRRPLADVLWKLYEERGYLAYVGGLPNGPLRSANLLKLHELARKFASFRRQGLHRFLRFLEALEEEEREIGSAPVIGEAEDVVRIMSIHQSKGLEFPVVFLAGLAAKFNLTDRAGRMIFERRSGIGLKVVDCERMIEYPSAAHRLTAEEIERTVREEELRVLYVAMTRAREKLVLVGSMVDVHDFASTEPPTSLTIAKARAPLDWLMPVMIASGRAATNTGQLLDAGRDDGPPVFEVHIHDSDAMARWRVVEEEPASDAVRAAAARGEALPYMEPLPPHDAEIEESLARLEYVYPSLASGTQRAAMAASELKGVYDYTRNLEEHEELSATDSFRVASPRPAARDPDSAAYRGVMTHRVLQKLDLSQAMDSAGVARELQRMIAEGWIAAEDGERIDLASLAWFASTPLAEMIRRTGGRYQREFPFITKESPDFLDPTAAAPAEDVILVRGIVDGILLADDGLEIVDYKTDAVDPSDAAARGERYYPQMTLYARAMTRIWRQPVRRCWLVFLTARRIVVLSDPASASPVVSVRE